MTKYALLCALWVCSAPAVAFGEGAGEVVLRRPDGTFKLCVPGEDNCARERGDRGIWWPDRVAQQLVEARAEARKLAEVVVMQDGQLAARQARIVMFEQVVAHGEEIERVFREENTALSRDVAALKDAAERRRRWTWGGAGAAVALVAGAFIAGLAL